MGQCNNITSVQREFEHRLAISMWWWLTETGFGPLRKLLITEDPLGCVFLNQNLKKKQKPEISVFTCNRQHTSIYLFPELFVTNDANESAEAILFSAYFKRKWCCPPLRPLSHDLRHLLTKQYWSENTWKRIIVNRTYATVAITRLRSYCGVFCSVCLRSGQEKLSLWSGSFTRSLSPPLRQTLIVVNIQPRLYLLSLLPSASHWV